jgi:peptidyl-prolyl cis-trans isomerase C
VRIVDNSWIKESCVSCNQTGQRCVQIEHILVTYEYEAQDLVRKLEQGWSFEELARKFSKCPSSEQGGNLGDLTGRLQLLDESFRDAALLLKDSEISAPVRTRFGWHLIRVGRK